MELLRIDETAAARQRDKLTRLRARRDPRAVSEALARLEQAAASPRANTMPATLDAVRAYATLGEIRQTLARVFGSWQERSVV